MQHRKRAIAVIVLLACGFTVISLNLIQIQLVQHDKFWKLAIENHLHPETIAPERGTIFDSDGNILAQTQVVYDIRIDGQQMTQPATDLPKLESALQLVPGSLSQNFNARNRYQLVATDADDGTVAKLKALKLNSLIYVPHDHRFYPNNELAAHILGFVDENGHGLAGMEKQMEQLLAGTPGERWVERDGKRNQIAGYLTREQPAIDGYDVTLTVNMAIQHVVETELDKIVQQYQPHGAYIIVMDPHTGEIMAMGSRPTFNPNDRKSFQPDSIRNRCITDAFEPGSIFKIITLSAALNEGAINLDTKIFCENGSFPYGGKVLHDDEKNGWLPVEEVLAKSSNIGFAKIALTYLGEDKLYKYASEFGIGQRTGIFDRQGESAGLFQPVSKWSALSITRIPMGQEVAATPLQMVTAMSVIANGGRLVTPHLAKQVTDSDGHIVKVFQPHIVRQVIGQDTAQDVTKALEQVVIDGTAKGLNVPGYSIAGKTGTAQKFVDGAYSHTKFVSSFIGFMPAQDPAFVALVMVDEPKTKEFYGAQVSAPIFAEIGKQAAQILNLIPDQPVTPAPALSMNTRGTP